MKVLVVDDEPLAQQRLQHLLTGMSDVDEVLVANNGLQAIDSCQLNKPEVVLLDIRMPGMDGLEAARHISAMEKVPAIIFITAYDEYALDAFKVHAVDYLLKPVREEKLKASLLHACQLNRAQLSAISAQPNCRSNITAKISGNIKLIPVSDILFFQAEQKYVTVKYHDGETIIEDTLKDLQVEFQELFIRIHRNALVAKQYVTGIHKDNEGRSFVTLKDSDKSLEISRRHLSSVKKLITSL
ncbi:LytR/AlgR family response regulator transcription factor [Aliikangiella coralliicola]|uniref:Response regulator transcription factor n=1 Tax=Aliikangiella coralliicola TaxID=2592383 RepID=A0A545UG16_9GAMM|nr:LytTR family DNA-binding domain-containing protein [Aliikangiella coralliicola]TQV88409.1 response regulator transcription factor [Aliikangiella coralliicola]